MPGRRLYSFHEGDRAEYLTTFFLSRVSAVVPVPRQEDYGLDHLCALTRRDEHSLYIGKAFGVQVKSGLNEKLSYGGLSENGKWKQWEVTWFYNQNYPMFIASVDKKKWELKLYSTIRAWFVLWKSGGPFQINLFPDIDRFEETKGAQGCRAHKVGGLGDGYGDKREWDIPLGKPVVEIAVKSLQDEEYCGRLYECLDRWITLDRKNITHHQMGIPFSWQYLEWEPNKPPEKATVNSFGNPKPERNINEIFNGIEPGIISLAQNLLLQKQTGKIKKVVPILELMADYKRELSRIWVDNLKTNFKDAE